MLYEFITLHRDDIVARTRDRVRGRPWPSISSHEIEHGVPLFLTQLSETLRLEATATPFSSDAIGSTAARHGAELLAAGFSVAQVVHDYGDICQAITEIAVEQNAPITVEEFHTLNRCLDTAIAEAVTEHTRLIAQKRSEEEVERLGQTAHELRDLLNGALLAFHALKRGAVAINGSTGAVLGPQPDQSASLSWTARSRRSGLPRARNDASDQRDDVRRRNRRDWDAPRGVSRHPVHRGAGRSRVGR